MRTWTVVLLAVASTACIGGPAPPAPTPPSPGGGGLQWNQLQAARFVAIAGSDAGNSCADPNRPCQTVQHAIDSSNPGDLITVAPGTYDEVLRWAIPVHIFGDSGTRSDTRLRGGALIAPAIPGLYKLEHFTLTPGGIATNGVEIQGLFSGVEVAVAQSAVGAYASHGVLAQMAGGTLRVVGSTLNRNSADGLHVQGTSGEVEFFASEANDNTGDGIQLVGIGGMTVKIDTSTASLNDEAGVQVETMSSGQVRIVGSCIGANGTQAGLSLSGITGGSISAGQGELLRGAAGGAGASIVASTVTPDVKDNWWGSPDGPSGAGGGSGASITPGFDFLPFRNAPLFTTTCG
jgi:hypothetical protein